MSVACPGCSRAYEAGRFAGGRAFHCACGARVGRRLSTGVPQGEGPPRFLADAMLGRLARWLRTLGYDTAWEPEIADPELVRRGVEEGRWILTTDRRLAEEWWVDNLLVLKAEAPLAQLAAVHRRIGLRGEALFSRCTRCNARLRPAPPERRDALPPGVRAEGGAAAECPACRRLYWQGSHTRRMRRSLEGVLGPLSPAPAGPADRRPPGPSGS